MWLIVICVNEFWEIQFKDILTVLLTVAIFALGYFLERKARKIQDLTVWKEFRDPIILFANEAIDTLSEVEGLCEANPAILKQEFWNKRNQLISRISSLRDRGKLLIPNEEAGRYGLGKSKAYSGIRHRSLDCLVAAYHITVAIDFKTSAHNLTPASLTAKNLLIQASCIKKALEYLPAKPSLNGPTVDGNVMFGWSCKQAIVEIKRQFLSEIQQVVNTRNWVINTSQSTPTRQKD